MANVRVALRVRPLSKRETKEGGRIIVEVDGKMAKIRNLKVDNRPDSFGDSREKIVAFGFDYCYWSVDPEDPHYASQDVVFQDLGTEVLSGAARGYNICLFAYGQTGSGKTYTMLGTPASVGLTPRICEGLFSTEEDCPPQRSSCRIKVSFLEIYNERVRDLLKQSDQKKSYTLRVREHPEMGPYVQGLSQHVVTNYEQVIQLLEDGIANRITAATHVHEASSRSHAIFTIHYTQATMENNLPSETASKINLVDLAGSERADPSYCKDRITEGANINKSLVTLGIVISALAQNSQVSSGCQSLSSTASGGDSGVPSSPSGTGSGGGLPRRQSYIPYRDSVLTWLLKDSLGGNSQTIMVATVSPAHTCYSETMSTLRYAANAKNIINKPQINEDANIKLIRELREEIGRLKAMLLSFKLRNFSSLVEEKDENLKELVLQNELKIDQLTKDWRQKWGEWKVLVEHYRVDINRKRAEVVINSSLPHLMALEDDVLSTGVVLYHLKEGITKIGRIDSEQEQDIVLQGQWIERDHCTITSACGVVILRPAQGARCTVNGREVTTSCRLTQGAVITLGKAKKFRFNHPAEAAVLRQRRQVGEPVGGSSGSLEWLDLDGDVTAPRFGLCPLLCKERGALQEQCEEDHLPPRTRKPQQQKPSGGPLRQQVVAGQGQSQEGLWWPIRDDQLQGEPCLASLQTQPQQDHVAQEEPKASAPSDAGPETEPETRSPRLVQNGQKTLQRQRPRPRRHSLRAAGRHSRRKRLSIQLERIFKKQKLLASQKRLEQHQALCWPWNDQTWVSLCQVPDPDTMVQDSQQSSNSSTSCSSLSLRALCIQYLRQLGSVFLKLDSSTSSPSIPDRPYQISQKTSSEEPQDVYYPPRSRPFSRNVLPSSGEGQLYTVRVALARKRSPAPDACLALSSGFTSVWEMERRGARQPCQMVSQSSASSHCFPIQLKLQDEASALGHLSQTRRTKGLVDSGLGPVGCRISGPLGTRTTAKGASGCSFHLPGPKQADRHGKATKAFWKHPNTVSEREHMVHATRVTDITKKPSYLPHGSPLKGQHSEGDPDPVTSLAVCCPAVDSGREKDDGDLSDAGSNYSVDSLCYVCSQELAALQRPKALQEHEQDLPEPENDESDDNDGQISEDSLAEKRYQSPQGSPRGHCIPDFPCQPRTRARALARDLTTSSSCRQVTPASRSFSLDSLFDTEEELGTEQQEEPSVGPSDEMPTETFWHPQTSSLPCGHLVAQDTICELGLISHRAEVRLDAIMPKNHSFHLEPEPCSEPPVSEVGVSSSSCEQASALQVMPPPSGSPLVSRDSWFSCDSKINSGSSPEIACSLCPSPEVLECQPCGWKRLKAEEPKPPGLPYSASMSQDGAESLCSVRAAYTIPSCVMSGLSFCRRHSLCNSGAEGTSQARGIPSMAQQDNCKVANNASTSGVLTPPAPSFSYTGSPCSSEQATLQQKYPLEQSHSVSGAVGGPQPTFSSLEEDSSSLTQVSCKRGSLMPVTPGLPGGLDFCKSPIHGSKIQHLRAEKEAHSLSVELEGTPGFSMSSKEVSSKDTHSAAGVSSASRSTKVWMVAADMERANQRAEAWARGRTDPFTSSDHSSSLKNSGHSNVIVATEGGHWAQTRAPPCSAGQPQQGSCAGHTGLQKMATPWHGADTDTPTAFLSSELCVQPVPWDPFSSSLQPPPLETFYLTRSRDALTETALEIPACRETQVASPPAREAWGFGCDDQALHRPDAGTHLSVLLHNPDPKMAPSQWDSAQGPTKLKVKDVSSKVGQCLGGSDHDGSDLFHSFVAPNKHFLLSAGTKGSEFKSHVGTFNTHSLPEFQVGELATGQSSCRVFPHNELRKSPLACITQTSGSEEQTPDGALQQTQHCDTDTHLPSPFRPGFICKTFNFDLDKDLPGEHGAPAKASPVHRNRVGHPKMVAWDESSAPRDEGKHETRLPGRAHHLEEEGVPRGAESSSERFQEVTCSQDCGPSDDKGSGRTPETSNLQAATSGKKPRVPDFEEMARLIRSVKQLENDILEMECKQDQLLSASYTLGTSEESALLDQRRQEVADLVHMLRSSESHLSFRVPPSPPKHSSDMLFKRMDAREMGLHSSTEHEPWDQKTMLSPARPWDCGQGAARVREYPQSTALDTLIVSSDYLESEPTFRSTPRASATAWTTEVLARALPLQSRTQSSSEKDNEQAQASKSPRRQPCGLGRPEEPQPAKGSKESQAAGCMSGSKKEEPQGQGSIAVGVQRGRRLRKGRQVVSPTLHLLSRGLYHNQETSPLPSLPDSSTASPQDLSSTSPSVSPRRLRSYLHASDTFSSLSSEECVLAASAPREPGSPSVSGAGLQDQGGQTRGPGPHADGGGSSSAPYFADAGSVTAALQGSRHQPSVSEGTAQGPEGRVPANSSPPDPGGGVRTNSMGTRSRVGFTEADTAVQRDVNPSQPTQRTHHPWEKGSRETRQKEEEEAMDFGPGDADPTLLALPRFPNPKLCAKRVPQNLDALEESQWLKALGKPQCDTLLPHYETLFELEYLLDIPARPQCQQVDGQGRTRPEGTAQGFHGTPLHANSAHVAAEEKGVLPATRLPADSPTSLATPETQTRPGPPSHTPSHAAPGLGRSCCVREPSDFLGAGEQYACHLYSSETREKEATGTSCFAGSLGSDSLPSSAAVKEDRRAKEGVEAPSASHGAVPQGQGLSLAAPETTVGRGESHTAQQGLPTPGTTSAGSDDMGVMAPQTGKNTHFERELVRCDPYPARLSRLNPDDAPCLEASISTDGGKAGSRAALEVPSLQRWTAGSLGSVSAEICRTGSEPLRPTLLAGVGAGQDPQEVGEKVLCSRQEQPCDAEFTGSIRKHDDGSAWRPPPMGRGHSPSCVPTTRRTISPDHSVASGNSRLVGDAESSQAPSIVFGEKKGHVELEAPALPTETILETPGEFQDSFGDCQKARVSQTVSETSGAPGIPHSFSSSQGSVECELALECSENIPRSFPEQPCLATRSRDDSVMALQAKLAAKLKKTSSPQTDSSWEEEEQQSAQAAGASGQGLSALSSEDSPKSCQGDDVGREKVATAQPPAPQMFPSHSRDVAAGPWEQSRESQVPAQHRRSLPVIAVFHGPEPPGASFQPRFSVVSSSLSLQKLNLGMEPPSSTHEETRDPSRTWNSQPETHPSEKSVERRFPTGCGGRQEARCEAGDQPLPAARPPYPTSPSCSCMPTPELLASWPAGALEQASERWAGRAGPEEGHSTEEEHSTASREVLYFGSSNLNLYDPHVCLQEPACIGWKQYVFSSAHDVSQNQSHQGAIPGSVDRCASMSEGMAGQDLLLSAHLSTYVQNLSHTHSSNENSRASQESWEACDSSLDLENLPIPTCPDGAAPKKNADKKVLFLGTPGVAGRAMGPAKEPVPLCPPQGAGCAGQAPQCILEQSTQTGCREASDSMVPIANVVSWDSVHSLSLHLSQLLHSTSELIESLSQPGVAEKGPDVKRERLEELSPALRMDGCTQTTVDEGTQTDPAQSPLRPHTPEADPQVSVFLEVLDSDNLARSQERGYVPETQPNGELEEKIAWKMAEPSDLQNEHPHFRPLSTPPTSFHLKFSEGLFGQNLLSTSPQASAASLTPSSQKEKLLCLAVSSLDLRPCPHVARDPTSAVLVDRATSPILTLSSSTHRLGPGALSFPSRPAHSPEDLESLVPSPGLPQDGPQPTRGDFPNAEELESCLRTLREVTGPLEKCCQEGRSLGSPQHSPKLQVPFKAEVPQHLQPQTSLHVQTPSPGLAQGSLPEDVASLDCGQPSDKELGQCQSQKEDSGETSAPPIAPHLTPGLSLLQGEPQQHSPCSVSELTGPQGLTGSNPQPEGQLLLCPSSQMSCDPELQPPGLRDLPVHNKFSHWCGVQDGALGTDVQGTSCDPHSWEQSGQRPPQPLDSLSRVPERSLRELIPLQVGTQSPSLSVELAEAKLHHGFGETDALLQVLQSGTGEALTAEESQQPAQEQLSTRQTIVPQLQSEQAEQPPNLRWPHSLSPHKKPHKDLLTRGLDLPSRRREYLQQLRKDVVETTRSPGVAQRSTQPPSDIELLLQEYQQAREAAKQEIVQARARLQERTEQEKLRIRRQIISQLQREEEKLHLLATSSSLCTSSNASFSSVLTSGYNSSSVIQLLSPDSMGDTNLPDSRDSWRGDMRCCSAVRSSNRNRVGTSWKSVASGNRTSVGSCCSPSSLSSAGPHFSSSYQDLAKHIVHISLADVMAACSNSLHNLFNHHEAAGWKYLGQEQEVQLYHKVFSSTRHGFLGAGLVLQPLSHVWAAVSDPTLWPLYHKPIQTVRLHQRVTNSINLVYLVCDTTVCALKQPRDFCCVCVEAKEGHLSIMAVQSIYDPSMPRPSREMIRGEILPSAWILQPMAMNGKEITRVIYLAQVELGAPGFPPQRLSSFIKQQPLVIAKLASFLGS
ncbi:stAR-related lipid transfer protein 9 [Sorex fumeus]|uniref:stAR-related lipid transfer protein 9 n=1 Tax=Sorex fumeus TaxID=62283 RepID=UPI0024AD6171|nr:stAR-related lipid transfer protein 9 [Sorex fumeus]